MKLKKILASLLAAALAFGTVAAHTAAAAEEPSAVGEETAPSEVDSSEENGGDTGEGSDDEKDKEYTITIDPDINLIVDKTTAKEGEAVTITISHHTLASGDPQGFFLFDSDRVDDGFFIFYFLNENRIHPREGSLTFIMPAYNVLIKGSGEHSASVNITETQNGTVKVGQDNIVRPFIVCGIWTRITPEPDEGYELDTLTATGLYDGRPLELVPLDENEYELIVPHDGVNITATFKKINSSEGDTDTSDPEPSDPATDDTDTSSSTIIVPVPSTPDEDTTSTESTVFEPVVHDAESLDEDTRAVLSGITVIDSNGAFEDGVVMNVSFIEKTSDLFKYDITFTKDGAEVQPNGKVTVKMPIPEFQKGGDIYIYHYDANGNRTLVPSRVENDFVIFEVDHFSTYALSNELLEDANSEPAPNGTSAPASNPSTGIGYALVPAMIAAGAVIVSAKKKK